ncbi:hypothetical protein WJX81_001370 [Elliptochloris bilobata]|uniref:Uncharacterized protein n=1 Tax=Elliptochloris bilobata TaxID=381761 RepID=A0AAW1RZM0_9CHLO
MGAIVANQRDRQAYEDAWQRSLAQEPSSFRRQHGIGIKVDGCDAQRRDRASSSRERTLDAGPAEDGGEADAHNWWRRPAVGASPNEQVTLALPAGVPVVQGTPVYPFMVPGATAPQQFVVGAPVEADTGGLPQPTEAPVQVHAQAQGKAAAPPGRGERVRVGFQPYCAPPVFNKRDASTESQEPSAAEGPPLTPGRRLAHAELAQAQPHPGCGDSGDGGGQAAPQAHG